MLLLEAMAVLLNMPAVWEKKTSIMSTNGDKEEYDMCQAVREWVYLLTGRVPLFRNGEYIREQLSDCWYDSVR